MKQEFKAGPSLLADLMLSGRLFLEPEQLDGLITLEFLFWTQQQLIDLKVVRTRSC